MKFKDIINGSTLSVSFYQDKRLHKVAGLKRKVHPIYLQLVYEKATTRVKSRMWEGLIKSDQAALFSSKTGGIHIFEIRKNEIREIVNNKGLYSSLCTVEYEVLKKIILFARENAPNDVNEITSSYNFYGEDGLRLISRRFLTAIGNYVNPIKYETDNELSDQRISRLSFHDHFSFNAVQMVAQLLESNLDPLSIFCFIDEMGIVDELRTRRDDDDFKTYYDDYLRIKRIVHNLITDLHNSFPLIQIDAEMLTNYKDESIEGPLRGINHRIQEALGLFYFPVIHFFVPSKFKHVDPMDLLKLQKYFK